MSNILTPTAMWSNFDDSLELLPETLSTEKKNGVCIERVSFSGRDTGAGRVKIHAAFATNAYAPEEETVIIFPDSSETVNEELLALFVKHGFSALMVDYRGEWENCENFTVYPENVKYANIRSCGRTKDYVDESAEKTCWYEWVAVGIYARKYVISRTRSERIAVAGIRDGGEIAWKLGFACKFDCIVPVNAAGWKAYSGVSKYFPDEPQMDEERYRFIAGIDSQAYATGVKCPVLMLCSTGDGGFDYDRAYDTFSRINPEFQSDSVIAYSVHCSSCIDADGTTDLFMFLDKNLKKHHVFLPKPAEISVTADSEANLTAKVVYDGEGIASKCSVYLAEDCADSAFREWSLCRKTERKGDFFLDIYEKTSAIFVLASVKYTNGFTAWSKIAVKKISGRFRNMKPRCQVIFSDIQFADGFSIADSKISAVGGVFFTGNDVLPALVVKANGGRGIYSVCGLSTNRMNNPRFAPARGSILKLDAFCDVNDEMNFYLEEMTSGEVYEYSVKIVGGVWQSVLAESKNFKTAAGAPLADFAGRFKFSILCGGAFAVNNVMWL